LNIIVQVVACYNNTRVDPSIKILHIVRYCIAASRHAKVDFIRAFIRIFNHCVGAMDIIYIIAGSPLEGAVAVTTPKLIIAVTAEENIVAVATVELVIAVITIDSVVAAPSLDNVVAATAINQLISSDTAFNKVIAVPAVHRIVAVAAVNGIIAGQTVNQVIAGPAGDTVVTVGACQSIIAVRSGNFGNPAVASDHFRAVTEHKRIYFFRVVSGVPASQRHRVVADADNNIIA